jgi:Fe-S-cluster containining protein
VSLDLTEGEDAGTGQASPCDACPVPGNCCRVIHLNGGHFPGPEAMTVAQAQEELDTMNRAELGRGRRVNGHLPFRPLYRHPDGKWALWCPNLDLRSGRCLDYANRPHACTSYQPGVDRNCVLHVAPEQTAPAG